MSEHSQEFFTDSQQAASMRNMAVRVWPFAVVLVYFAQMAHAQASSVTDIANEPLITMSAFQAKPNLMVILDDSGSMARAYMPDEMSGTANLGYASTQCNGVAFDPAYTYTPPLEADGTSYSDVFFNEAWVDGFVDGAAATDLGSTSNSFIRISTPSIKAQTGALTLSISSLRAFTLDAGSFVPSSTITLTSTSGNRSMTATVTAWEYSGSGSGVLKIMVSSASGVNQNATASWNVQFNGQAYYTYHGSESAMNWVYTANNGTVDTSTTFYKQCFVSRNSSNTASDSGVFALNVVTNESPEELRTNYANWYAYYRNRRLLMRTAMGQAFGQLDDAYRVGFMTLNQTSISEGESFRDVRDFDINQKSDFYTSLYSVGGTSVTPSRRALSRAGRYFAKKETANQSYDPVQYACQRNFALLTTDGYWNSTAGRDLNGVSIGNSDGGVGAPYQDDYSGTLADVAYYYYITDLRPDMEDVVPPVGGNTATHQHMVTFAIGMGVNGTLQYDKNYLSQASGDYVDLKNGVKSWPDPPSTANLGDARNIDDLWHAAINGRGQYYSAMNAGELSEAIQGVVSAVQETTGAASATATSTLDLVQGDDNIAYEASYTTGVWTGDVLARMMDPATAELESGDPEWSANDELSARDLTTSPRTIYFNSASSLAEFNWTNLGGLQSQFADRCPDGAYQLSQCNSLTTSDRALLNNGEHLVEYLRGVRTHEVDSTGRPLFRKRAGGLLGDIINSKPIHVGAPPFSYDDTGYADFKSAQSSRQAVVYVGANDGMLHALNADTGKELWAFIPTEVIPELYVLADTRYGTTSQPHRYYVDGKTVQGDVFYGGAWRTILVGGLNSGGRSYYALDITDPANPSLLWEFTDDNLGLTYSDPIITKLADGSWVVAFGSGYNNVSPGDGQGYLFVVDAVTGAKDATRTIGTGVGSVSAPSGLAKINVWVTSYRNNTAERFYAGDLLGNVWRFDVDDKVQPHKGALLLAQMVDGATPPKPQPITTEIKLQEYEPVKGYKVPLAVVTTGRYLGSSDITDDQVQSIAAIRDPLTDTGWGVVRTNTADFVERILTKSGDSASATAADSVDWLTQAGWWADFPTAGERVHIAAEWDGSRLLVATAIPEGDNVCISGGSSWLYSFVLATGAANGQEYSDETLIVGFSVVYTSDGRAMILVRESEGETKNIEGEELTKGGGSGLQRARRVSWRELVN